MIVKKNKVNLKSFCALDWRKYASLKRFRELHNEIIAWLLNPYGDHGLETGVLEGFMLKLGLGRTPSSEVSSIGQNHVLEGYVETGGMIDVVLETDGAQIMVINEPEMARLEDTGYPEELRGKTAYLTDNLKRNAKNLLVLLSPSGYIPPRLDGYVKKNSYLRVFSYRQYTAILQNLLLYEVRYRESPKLYGALERYMLFLQLMVADVYGAEQRKSRLASLKGIVP